MSPALLLSELARLGARPMVHGDDLVVDARKGALPAEQHRRLTMYKTKVIAALIAPPVDDLRTRLWVLAHAKVGHARSQWWRSKPGRRATATDQREWAGPSGTTAPTGHDNRPTCLHEGKKWGYHPVTGYHVEGARKAGGRELSRFSAVACRPTRRPAQAR
jgi:hypothetical protein